VEHNILQVNIYFLFLTEGARARREALKVVVATVGQDGIACIGQQLTALPKATLPRPLRDDALIQGVLLNAILKELRILALRLQLYFFLRIQL